MNSIRGVIYINIGELIFTYIYFDKNLQHTVYLVLYIQSIIYEMNRILNDTNLTDYLLQNRT